MFSTKEVGFPNPKDIGILYTLRTKERIENKYGLRKRMIFFNKV